MPTSSCKLRVKWFWTDLFSSGKWSRQEEIYREVHPKIDSTHEGYPVVVTKNRVRGNGQAAQFEFVSESGKSCDLLGWGVVLEAARKL